MSIGRFPTPPLVVVGVSAALMLVAGALVGVTVSWGPTAVSAQTATSPITPDAAIAQRLAALEERAPTQLNSVVALVLAFLAGGSNVFAYRRGRRGGGA